MVPKEIEVGFREVGRIPNSSFKDAEIIDEVRLALEL